MSEVGKGICKHVVDYVSGYVHKILVLSHAHPLNRAQLQWPVVIKEVHTFSQLSIRWPNMILYFLCLYPSCSSHLLMIWSFEDSNRKSSITHLWALTKHQLMLLKSAQSHSPGWLFTGWPWLLLLLRWPSLSQGLFRDSTVEQQKYSTNLKGAFYLFCCEFLIYEK